MVNIGYTSQTITLFVLVLFTHYFSLQTNPFNKLDLFCLRIVFGGTVYVYYTTIYNIHIIHAYTHTPLHPPTYELRNVPLAIYGF